MLMFRAILVTLCFGVLCILVSTARVPSQLGAPNPEGLLPVLSPIPTPQPVPGQVTKQVFDITKYGAVGDAKIDSSQAILATWKDACNNARNSRFLIPKGTYLVGPILLRGPCKGNQSPEVVIMGTLKAPSSLDRFSDSDSSWLGFQDLQELRIIGQQGVTLLDGQGEEAWSLKRQSHGGDDNLDSLPRTLKFENVFKGNISDVSVVNSKGFHISIKNSTNFTVHGLNITAPWDSPNTDGIHVSDSSDIKIQSSIIRTGDDCVSIGPGSFNIHVFNVTCGPGHGISVGSLGKNVDENDVREIDVRNCTINGTQNGIRIKTWPGSPPSNASNMTFEDIQMINVSNPIIIDQEYCADYDECPAKPSLVQISNIAFKKIWGTSWTIPVTLNCSLSVPCQNVTLNDINLNVTNPRLSNISNFLRYIQGNLHELVIKY